MTLLLATAFGFSLAALFCAVTYLRYYCDKEASEAKRVIKTAATSLLALVSLILTGPLSLTIALGLGAVGDYMLARDTKRAFLIGLISFALAHLVYAGMMAQTGHGAGSWSATALLLMFGAAMAAVLFPKSGELRWPVMAYIAIIVLMGITAFGTGQPILIIAALLFSVSDAVLSLELFVLPTGAPAQKFTPYVVWSTYWTAQALFLYGFLAV